MPPITLKPVGDLSAQVARVLARVQGEVRQMLSNADLEHIGATAIPGCVTKGDIDVVVRVAPDAFPQAIEILSARFEIKQRANWTSYFASFGDDGGYDLPLGIQLVTTGLEGNFLVFIRDHLLSHPGAVAEYNDLKVRHAEKGAHAYWEAKNAFFSAILASRS